MTLANGLWTKSAVYLWSDTAYWASAYSAKRRIVMHQPKLAVGEDWPYAFVTSGNSTGLAAVASAVLRGRPRNFWELRDCVRGALAEFVGKGDGGRTLIASFADQPRMTMIDSEQFCEYPPLTVMELRPQQICSNAGRPETMRLIEAGVTVDTMPDIIRAQHSDWDHENGALIAGTIGRVKVTRRGVEAADIDELPDPTAGKASGGT
ncbi:MAG: hypothetical protein ACK4ZW_07310 [Blastomonas sp.]